MSRLIEMLLPGRRPPSFRHGIHPDPHKAQTSAEPIRRMPFVPEYVLPLSQHLGAPSVPIVGPGQRVRRGELIAEPGRFVSVALHSPVAGVVVGVDRRPHPDGRPEPAIVIRTDPYDAQRDDYAPPPPVDELTPDEVRDALFRSGVVGLGGAAFPAHVKLTVPEGKQVETFLLNGAECEPFLTCDHRVMVERAPAVIRGLRIAMRVTQARRGVIGVEENKPDAIEALTAAARGIPERIDVTPLRVKYPQGAKQLMIDTLVHARPPRGGRSTDVGVVIGNIGTSAAEADYLDRGKPLIERVVTVGGPGVRRPGNYLVPIGTPVSALLEHCGGLGAEVREVVLGGPMMGTAQKDLSVPILKATPGVLALTDEVMAENPEQPCIRCGRCVEACPMFLNPSRLALAVRADDVEQLAAHHMSDCFECGSCAFSCPSNIPLLQLMRMGHRILYERGTKS